MSEPRTLCLDGVWELIPGDDPSAPGTSIEVPGLWEAAGHADLDGVAWYRRRFDLDEIAGRWTLTFGAVMDEAEVFLNGTRAGMHEGAFTPFGFDVSGLLREGGNELAVRVVDYAAGDQRHQLTAHGKQGWMNDVFPSPPSLYMNYGGIWQSVHLERHGDVRIEDTWINSDPANLVVAVELSGAAGAEVAVELELLGSRLAREVRLVEGATRVVFELGRVDAARWSPSSPTLHDARVVVATGGERSHTRSSRFGLRTVSFARAGLRLDGELVRIQSALVQGFRADTLYAEGSRAAIEAEVRAARDAGLNMLRLHIKAFDPRYLDVCDELGMLVHCDIPVAEPIAHGLLGADGSVADTCARTAREQVRRDRNHPSIVLWSAMNELGVEDLPSRASAGYEGFARRLYAAVEESDGTRPVIENDWIEPDPDRVFCSPLLTAHWYGRLTAPYLRDLTARTVYWSTGERPLFVSEFGDWGLPALDPDTAAFWAYGDQLATAIGSSAWPGSPAAFVEGTHRYQGLADRLQIEIFRSTPGVVGWCLTELTDVPQEFNGLFDIHRAPKRAAIEEVARACQTVLPVIRRTSWTMAAETTLEDDVLVVNDGPALDGCRLRVRLAAREQVVDVGRIEAHAVTGPITVQVEVPRAPGTAELELVLEHQGARHARNTYPLHVVAERSSPARPRVSAIGDDQLLRALRAAGIEPADGAADVLVIGEGALDERSAEVVAEQLRQAGDVLLLAQPAHAAGFLPIPLVIKDLTTEWGSTPFIYSTDAPGAPSIPARTVLTTELLEVTPDAVWTVLDGTTLAVETLIGVMKPPPAPVIGTVVGRLPVSEGVLTLCQLPLTEMAVQDSALAITLLRDLIDPAS
jgi:hypothetical protein